MDFFLQFYHRFPFSPKLIESKRFNSFNFTTKTAISKSNSTKAVPYATKSITINLIQFWMVCQSKLRSTTNNCPSQLKRIKYLIQNEWKTKEKRELKRFGFTLGLFAVPLHYSLLALFIVIDCMEVHLCMRPWLKTT